MKYFPKFIVILFTAVVTPAALAGDPTLFGYADDSYGPKKSALTATMFSGLYLHGKNQDLLDTKDRTTDAWDYGLRLGWAFVPEIELEASFGYTPTKTASASQNVYYYTADVVGQWPMGSLAPYLTVGLGGITLDEEGGSRSSRFALDYGVGLKVFLCRNLALRPEFRLISRFKGGHTAMLPSVGLTYYAGSAKAAPAASPPEVKISPVPTPPPVPTPTPAAPTPTPATTMVSDRDIDAFSGAVEGITFASGSSVIEQTSYPLLDRFVVLLKKHTLLQVRIEGHTDGDGKEPFNFRLSRERAESVRQYLVYGGVKHQRLQIAGFGSSRPIADNSTATGKSLNRRIEFKFVNPDVLSGP